jgi:hypothetical protein
VGNRIQRALLRGVMNLDLWLCLLVGAVAFWFYLFRFGWWHLDPTNVDWLLAGGDAATYQIGWSYFRHEPWSWPLGRIQGYLAPMGASIPMVDAIPLAAIPLKAIEGLLPDPMQYMGAWTALCHVLMAITGYLFIGHFTQRRSVRVLAALFFLAMPPFLIREGHIGLSSHWLILGGFTAYFRLAGCAWSQRALVWGGLVLLTSTIHPYLTVMILGLCLASFWRSALTSGNRLFRLRDFVSPAGMVALVLASFAVTGYLIYGSEPEAGRGGYGFYSMNLNSLFNPSTPRAIMANRTLFEGAQWEGFGYLGFGILMLVPLALAGMLVRSDLRRTLREHVLLLIMLVVEFVFAASNVVTFDDQRILRYDIAESFDPLLYALRSSGRFVWPVAYAIVAWVIVATVRMLSGREGVALLALALALQGLDLRARIPSRLGDGLEFVTRLQDPRWQPAAAAADTLHVVPGFSLNHQLRNDFREFGWLAASHRIPVTTGYTARRPSTPIRKYQAMVRERLRVGDLNPKGLYVLLPNEFALGLPRATAAGWGYGRWDDYFVLVPPDFELTQEQRPIKGFRSTFADFLFTRPPDETVLMAIRDEGTSRLSDASRDSLRELGLETERLEYRASLAAVFHDGRFVGQRIGMDAIDWRLAPGDRLGDWTAPTSMHLYSASYGKGNDATLKIGNEDLSLDGRGFNVAVLDSTGSPRWIGTFDTHSGDPGGVFEIFWLEDDR